MEIGIMYTIFFVNFWYSPDRNFSTLKAAIEFAKLKGFDAAIRRNGESVGYWSIIGGFRKF